MTTAAVLDFAELTQPIDGEKPSGEDLRLDSSPASIYYRIKDVRSRAREVERHNQMNGDEDGEKPEWAPILMLAPDVIATKSKDLEITAYLLEALVREQGLAGLRDGFVLVRQLVESFGENLYPEPDEDGTETLVAPLTGLNGEDGDGTLILPIKQVPITADTSVGLVTASDYREAVELERASADQRERRVELGATTMEDVRIAVSETPAETFRGLLDDCLACLAEFEQSTAVLDAKFGQHSPPSTNIQRALEEYRDTIKLVAADKLSTLEPSSESDDPSEEGEPSAEGDVAAPARKPAGTIETREDAFRQILKVADFFRRTEPHSPLSYGLERIVRWGRLSLPDLMKELIADDTSVMQMFNLVGIESPPED